MLKKASCIEMDGGNIETDGNDSTFMAVAQIFMERRHLCPPQRLIQFTSPNLYQMSQISLANNSNAG